MGWYVIITKATVPFATVIDYRQMFPHGQAPMPILTKLQKEKNKVCLRAKVYLFSHS